MAVLEPLSTMAGEQPDIETMLDLYRMLQIVRRTEEQLARSHQQGLIHGACHTYVGEEAIATGVCAHLRPEDAVFSTHRGHGHALAKGVPPREVIAELYGRETGVSRGRGGSMHLFSPEVGMMGTSGIVGPCILQATGAGYSFKLRGTDNVGVAFFGDGASNNGAFHEGLNMASAWNLPVLYVCENNLYATEIALTSIAGNPNIAERAIAYGMPGVVVDGNDVVAVWQAAGEAIARARRGEGPTLLECRTYRTRAHAEGMRDTGYRSRDEVDAWKARDPIPAQRAALDAAGVETALVDAIDVEVQAMVAEGAQFAADSKYPDGAFASTHVYSEA